LLIVAPLTVKRKRGSHAEDTEESEGAEKRRSNVGNTDRRRGRKPRRDTKRDAARPFVAILPFLGSLSVPLCDLLVSSLLCEL
jgi:hypothetical protein